MLTTKNSVLTHHHGLPWWLSGKESACDAGDVSSIPELGRSPEEGNGNPFQYSCLENPMDRGAWWVTVHAVARIIHDVATKPLLLITTIQLTLFTHSTLPPRPRPSGNHHSLPRTSVLCLIWSVPLFCLYFIFHICVKSHSVYAFSSLACCYS